MKFIDVLRDYETIVENGPLGTRLQYDYKFNLGPNMATFDLIEQEYGRQALSEIYIGDIDIAQECGVPIIVNAATFRSSRNHLNGRGFDNTRDINNINIGCIDFIKNIREKYNTNSKAPILIAAALGSMHDAYSTQSFPNVMQAKEYHQEQIELFKKAQVDFVNAVTIPSLSEALGIALAAEENNIQCTIGFVLNENGTLLDGTLLHHAIRLIDEKTIKNPVGYLITCTHSSIIDRSISTLFLEYNRLLGAQANGSSLVLEELKKLDKPVADSPHLFASELVKLKKKFNWKIIAGCCGTSKEHLRALIDECKHN